MSVDSDDKSESTDDQTGIRSDPQLALLTYVAVQESKMSSDAPATCQSSPDTGKESIRAVCSCGVDVDIEMGNLDKMKTNEETGGSIKSEISLTKALRRQNSLQMGGEASQPIMNHILMLLKLDPKEKQSTEKAHEAPNSRWRKYKRPAAFDSRQIVLLFSILSSMGTIVLIYLTLRVRHAGKSIILV